MTDDLILRMDTYFEDAHGETEWLEIRSELLDLRAKNQDLDAETTQLKRAADRPRGLPLFYKNELTSVPAEPD